MDDFVPGADAIRDLGFKIAAHALRSERGIQLEWGALSCDLLHASGCSSIRRRKALMLRVIAYWFFCILAITQILLVWKVATAPPGPFLSYFRFDQLWQEHGMVAIAAVLLLPIMLVDVLSTSNRFAGPVYRMRRSLRALGQGEYTAPINFRKGDFWPEMADEFNAVAAYVERLKQQAGVANAKTVALPDDERELEPLGR